MDLGLPKLPDWMVATMCVIFAIGFIVVIGGICYGAYYLISHLHWK